MNRTLIQSILTIVVACSTSLELWAGKKPYVIRNHELSSKILEIRDYVTSQGGSVVDLTPEKDLIVWFPDTFDPSQSSYTIASCERFAWDEGGGRLQREYSFATLTFGKK